VVVAGVIVTTARTGVPVPVTLSDAICPVVSAVGVEPLVSNELSVAPRIDSVTEQDAFVVEELAAAFTTSSSAVCDAPRLTGGKVYERVLAVVEVLVCAKAENMPAAATTVKKLRMDIISPLFDFMRESPAVPHKDRHFILTPDGLGVEWVSYTYYVLRS